MAGKKLSAPPFCESAQKPMFWRIHQNLGHLRRLCAQLQEGAGSMSDGSVQRLGGSCRLGGPLVLVGVWLKQLAEPRTERSVEDCAANPEQEIGTSSGPSHLLQLVHAPVDEEVGGAFGGRSSDTQSGTLSLGIVDEPAALTSG